MNGALSELGETLATNITSKGVSASASDGLTTLANKVLQITGGGGSTIIFEDTGSASGVSNYTNHILLTSGSVGTVTITYDTTKQAYHMTRSGGSGTLMLVIDELVGLTDDFKITCDVLSANSSAFADLGYAQNVGTGFIFGSAGSYWEGHKYQNNTYQGAFGTTGSVSSNTWYTLELIKEGTSITINCWDTSMSIKYATTTQTYSDGNNYYGFFMEPSTGYWKNVKAEYLDTPSPSSDCSQYQTEISNAIEYINGSGS